MVVTTAAVSAPAIGAVTGVSADAVASGVAGAAGGAPNTESKFVEPGATAVASGVEGAIPNASGVDTAEDTPNPLSAPSAGRVTGVSAETPTGGVGCIGAVGISSGLATGTVKPPVSVVAEGTLVGVCISGVGVGNVDPPARVGVTVGVTDSVGKGVGVGKGVFVGLAPKVGVE